MKNDISLRPLFCASARRQYLRSMGVNASISEEPTPAEFQAISQLTKERPDAQQIHTMLLRSMSQAIYTPINSGHFGLAYEAYTHFTSPIRRYPDLLVHRVIKSILAKSTYKLPNLPTPGEAVEQFKKRIAARRKKDDAFLSAHGKKGRATPEKLSKDQQSWEAAGLHCSANERRADEASKDVEAWLKCKFMKEHLGEEYAGTVSSATSFGLFVTLDAMYVEGLIHITELGGEYFRFDETRQELRGERTGIRYALGSRVRVQVSRVDLDGRKIDFRLIREGEMVRVGGSAKDGIAGGALRFEPNEMATAGQPRGAENPAVQALEKPANKPPPSAPSAISPQLPPSNKPSKKQLARVRKLPSGASVKLRCICVHHNSSAMYLTPCTGLNT
ncbi:MAG: RNB domain-containing ribonuclease [Brachymonas sp.]|nr:RNB domain-containing ribonuclease [Brachymonas sp.]